MAVTLFVGSDPGMGRSVSQRLMLTSRGRARSHGRGEEDRECEVHPGPGVPRSLVSTSVVRSVIEVRHTVPPRMLQFQKIDL